MDIGLEDISKYSYVTPPPADHPDLGKWVWDLFCAAYTDKQNLGIYDKWARNYKLFHNKHWNHAGTAGIEKQRERVS